MEIVAVLLLSAVLSFLLNPAAIRVSRFLNIFDNPHRDRIHKNPTPVLGGVAICFAVLIAIITANILDVFFWSRLASGILVGGILIALVGFIDDRYGMTASLKMAGQVLAAGLFVVFADIQLGIFHPIVEFGASIFFLVTMMNAFNILDNMDGVTGSMSFAVAMAFLAIFILTNDHNSAVLAAALIGAIIGFLNYNMPRAKIFMGDAGAMFLGYIFGAFALIYLAGNHSFYLLTTPFLILSYPIFDISLVSFSRLRETRALSVAAPDSSPYRLVRWVFSTKNAFIIILGINFVLGAMGVASYIFTESQFSVLLIFICGLALSVLGVHLYRNFLYFIERTIFFILDIVSVNLAFYLIYNLKYGWNILHYDVYIAYSDMFAPALWMSIFWVLLFSVMGIYEIRPDRRFLTYIAAVFKIIGTGFIGFLILNIFYEGSIVVSFLPIILYLASLIVLNCVFKYIAFIFVRIAHRKPAQKPKVALLIKDSAAPVREILASAKEWFQVDGYISAQDLKLPLDNLPYLGEISKLAELIKMRRLEKIILVWSEKDYDDFTDILRSSYFLENQFIIIGNPPDPFRGFKIERLYRRGTYKVSLELLRTWEWIIKRAFDMGLSSVLLIITSPIFLFKYIGSKLKRQPFLVKISFNGRNGDERTCYDFYGHAAKCRDHKYLCFGLPALITIFGGHLSFVGILPLIPAQYQKDLVVIPGFWRRKFVKPGLAGPAHLHREENYFDYELKYLERMSTLLDIWWICVGILMLFKILPGKKSYVGSEIH